jgi:hypothetical protein
MGEGVCACTLEEAGQVRAFFQHLPLVQHPVHERVESVVAPLDKLIRKGGDITWDRIIRVGCVSWVSRIGKVGTSRLVRYNTT